MGEDSFDIVAFDIGGTQGRCGVARVSSGAAFELTQVKALRRGVDEHGPEWLDRLMACAKDVCTRQPRFAAVSFGGPVSPDGSIQSMHVSGWDAVDLVGRIASEFGLARTHVFVENDANAGALGESRYGAGRGCLDMLYFTVSTGIGGGVILNGSLRRGAHGMAGEFGHMIMDGDPNAPFYAAGKPGALEALASGPAMEREGREALRRAGRDVPEALSAKVLFDAAELGEAWAVETRRTCVGHLARGIAATVCAYDVERVVVGGGVALAGEALFGPLREAVAVYLPKFMSGKVAILPAELGDRAPMFGAIAACLDAQSENV
ncbi:MAG: ROK family protein [Planctomycetota bacterium]